MLLLIDMLFKEKFKVIRGYNRIEVNWVGSIIFLWVLLFGGVVLIYKSIFGMIGFEFFVVNEFVLINLLVYFVFFLY